MLDYPDVGREGRCRGLPVRHRVGHGTVAGPAVRDVGRQLPQHHAARADGALGQPPRPRPAAGPGRPAPARAPDGARGRGLRLQRGASRRVRLRRHRRDPTLGRPRRRRHGDGTPRTHAVVAARRAAGRAGWRWGGSRPTRRSRARSPLWPWRAPTATPDATLQIIGKPATDSYVASLAALRGRDGTGRCRHLRRSRQRRRPLRRRTAAPMCWW